VFGLRAPEEISGFTLNDSTNFVKLKPGGAAPSGCGLLGGRFFGFSP
jgi:hypothetical protein